MTADDTMPGLLEEFAEATGVEHAIVAARDGRLLAWSPELDRTAGDQFAAISSQLFSLATGTARELGRGRCEHVVVRTGRGAMLVFPAGGEARLAVVCRPDADLAVVGGGGTAAGRSRRRGVEPACAGGVAGRGGGGGAGGRAVSDLIAFVYGFGPRRPAPPTMPALLLAGTEGGRR